MVNWKKYNEKELRRRNRIRKINNIKNILFYELQSSGDNGIMGPGYRYWENYKFSFGKISFYIILICVIYFILK